MDPEVREHGHGRRDAERNREALVAAAITTLAEDPAASMDRIAAAAEVGRATLYRHFPNREDLVEAILRRVIAEAHETAANVLADDVSPREALGTLAREMAVLGERFRFMAAHRVEVAAVEARMEPATSDALETYLRRAQRRGDVPRVVKPTVAGHLLRGVLIGLMEAVRDGRLKASAAPAEAERCFVALLGLDRAVG